MRSFMQIWADILRMWLEQIKGNAALAWLSMAEWRQLMKRVGKFKYDIYWNKKYCYSKGSAKTDWDFVLNLFSFSVGSSSYLSSF